MVSVLVLVLVMVSVLVLVLVLAMVSVLVLDLAMVSVLVIVLIRLSVLVLFPLLAATAQYYYYYSTTTTTRSRSPARPSRLSSTAICPEPGSRLQSVDPGLLHGTGDSGGRGVASVACPQGGV